MSGTGEGGRLVLDPNGEGVWEKGCLGHEGNGEEKGGTGRGVTGKGMLRGM